MEKNLRIAEALAVYNAKNENKESGVKTQIYLASKIWPDSNVKTQKVMISRLSCGKLKFVSASVIKIICEETGTSPNFLFGYSEKDGFDW